MTRDRGGVQGRTQLGKPSVTHGKSRITDRDRAI